MYGERSNTTLNRSFIRSPIAGIVGRDGARPARHLGQRLVVAAVDCEHMDAARDPRLESSGAVAHGARAQVVGGVEHQHQPVVGMLRLGRGIVGEGEAGRRLVRLHHRQETARELLRRHAGKRIAEQLDAKRLVVGGDVEVAVFVLDGVVASAQGGGVGRERQRRDGDEGGQQCVRIGRMKSGPPAFMNPR